MAQLPEQTPARAQATRQIIQRVFWGQIAILALAGAWVAYASIFPAPLGSFQLSMLAGALGASVSLIRRLRVESEATLQELASSRVATFMPLLYGAVMACVAYGLFMSAILTGDSGGGLFTSNLFPNFTVPGAGSSSSAAQALTNSTVLSETNGPASSHSLTIASVLAIRPVQVVDFGKLLVWSLVAGYSESFVATVLGALERKTPGR